MRRRFGADRTRTSEPGTQRGGGVRCVLSSGNNSQLPVGRGLLGWRNEETPIELWPEPPPFRGFLFEAASQLLRSLNLGQARNPGLSPATAFRLSALAPLPRELGRNSPPKPLPAPSVSTESLR